MQKHGTKKIESMVNYINIIVINFFKIIKSKLLNLIKSSQRNNRQKRNC